jgi:hypothetical protein
VDLVIRNMVGGPAKEISFESSSPIEDDSGYVLSGRGPATVRSPPKLGRDDECFQTVLAKPGPWRNRSVVPMLAAL